MIIQMASATLVWVALAVIYLWVRRRPKKFEVGQIVKLVPRKKGWDRGSPVYSNTMVELQKNGALFEVTWIGGQEDVTIRLIDTSKRPLYVCPRWITPAKHILKNI